MNIKDYLFGNRLKHSLAVKKEVRLIIEKLRQSSILISDKEAVLKIAELHDIGYSERVMKTGFHPLDGYLYLKDKEEPIISLGVLLHSNAKELVQHLSADIIEEFSRASSLEQLSKIDRVQLQLSVDIVSASDMQIDGFGNVVTMEERYKDVCNRYGEKDYRATVMLQSMDYYNELQNRWKLATITENQPFV